MIKRLIRLTSYGLVLLGFGASGTSCGGDDESDLCYECEGYIFGATVDETYCFSDYKDDYTKEEFMEMVEYFENYDSGNDCKKK